MFSLWQVYGTNTTTAIIKELLCDLQRGLQIFCWGHIVCKVQLADRYSICKSDQLLWSRWPLPGVVLCLSHVSCPYAWRILHRRDVPLFLCCECYMLLWLLRIWSENWLCRLDCIDFEFWIDIRFMKTNFFSISNYLYTLHYL